MLALIEPPVARSRCRANIHPRDGLSPGYIIMSVLSIPHHEDVTHPMWIHPPLYEESSVVRLIHYPPCETYPPRRWSHVACISLYQLMGEKALVLPKAAGLLTCKGFTVYFVHVH